MSRAGHSSGDPIADKRYAYAEALAAEGDLDAAADLHAQALEIVPDWVAGWIALGNVHLRAGHRDAAVGAFDTALRLDPADLFGARLKRALATGEAPPETAPAAYVAGLFDQYADRFEAKLLGELGYRAPGLIRAALDRVAEGRVFAAALDLGCGTGLMAAELVGRVGAIDGVDLSAGMLAEARGKGLYRALIEGEMVAVVEAMPDGAYDLVTAADVFCYVGDLAPVFGAVARVARPGALLAFSVEHPDEDEADDGFVLRPSMRYAHGLEPLAVALSAAGFALRDVAPDVLRLDRGEPVLGLVVVAERT